MSFELVTSKRELARANATIIRRLKAAKTSVLRKQKIVHRPGDDIADVHWLGNHGIWFAFKERADHFWLVFGATAPVAGAPLRITVEINTPKAPAHGRAGLILTKSGRTYIGHTGRVGGGVAGITRENFLKYRGPSRNDSVVYNSSREGIALADISNKGFVGKIAAFVQDVAQFKNGAYSSIAIVKKKEFGKPFKPKFTGTVKRKARGEIQIKLLHDLVCEALNKKLPPPGGYQTQERDIFLRDKNGRLSALYEIKTDCSTSSVYKGVGQLLLNSFAKGEHPRNLVLVLRESPTLRRKTQSWAVE